MDISTSSFQRHLLVGNEKGEPNEEDGSQHHNPTKVLLDKFIWSAVSRKSWAACFDFSLLLRLKASHGSVSASDSLKQEKGSETDDESPGRLSAIDRKKLLVDPKLASKKETANYGINQAGSDEISLHSTSFGSLPGGVDTIARTVFSLSSSTSFIRSETCYKSDIPTSSLQRPLLVGNEKWEPSEEDGSRHHNPTKIEQ
ncbi:mitochondrial inner membrane protease subunit 1 [Striga asiatica]|uniref:Mitochondrial inner membrane protease subunit 1 n=1 Tax=Striga asiatica TaxID=4170 RepID=A0A5A7R5H6_STRAF|nr:mitochondrial inner membrane protease subunit 1 [Striga asiatica]